MVPRVINASPAEAARPSLDNGENEMTSTPVVRISISRCDALNFDNLREMMIESEAALRPGIAQLPGFLAFYAGADSVTLSLMNTSIWDTVEHAQQLDRFQPMLEAGKQFAAAGATFERPIMNYATLWHFEP